MDVTIKITIDSRLEADLRERLQKDFDKVKTKQLAQIMQRSKEDGGTPVDSSELVQSGQIRPYFFVYVKDYAGFVEFGHWTRNKKRFIPGQYYLKRNVNTQQSIFVQDVRNFIEKG